MGATLCVLSTPGARAQLVATDTHNGTPTKVEQVRVTVEATNVPLTEVLQSIARQAGLFVFWDENNVDTNVRVSVHLRDIPLDEAITKVTAGTRVQGSLVAGRLVLSKSVAGTVMAQGIIAGKVTESKTKRPLRGVTVTIDAAKRGVITGDDGTFRIPNVAAGEHTVHLRLLGYGKVTKVVTVTYEQVVTMDLVLDASANQLEQVVVTGTVVPTELKAVPNAITIITAKELQDRGITRIDQLFRGDVPGLFTQRLGAAAVAYTDRVPGSADVSARGGTFLGGGHESIKIYVDGVEMANRAYIGLIDPTSIERIEILTGPQASTIYGSNAISGVMQVFTKRGQSLRPQITAEARSEWTQNNLNAALAPKHTANLSASGVNGEISYNMGGSWGYTGSWTPGVREQTLSGFAGERLTVGRLTVDGNLRVMQDGNLSRAGGDLRPILEGIISGNGPQVIGGGAAPVVSRGTSTDHAYGATGTYAVAPWWSHTVTLGFDHVVTFSNTPGQTYRSPNDTTSYLLHIDYTGFTAAYNTTAQVPLTSLAKAVVTVGMDESHQANGGVSGDYVVVNGAYNAPHGWGYGHSQSHEHGGFLQSQVGVWDALFFTYGLRAVYNPNIGKNQNPNIEPRYGIALTQAFGELTAKLRASYGTATRPPSFGAKDEQRIADSYVLMKYGTEIFRLANPELVPESQQGGEGGLELYVGNRGSLQITRYNQTVDHLIVEPIVDSVHALPAWVQQDPSCADPSQCNLHQTQNLNIGSVRNQGWEMRGTFNLWQFTATGTYSWNKSRLIGITPKYRGQFPRYVVGAPFALAPEHTYAVGLAYVRGGRRISYNIQGQGAWLSNGSFFWARTGNSYATRLRSYNSRINQPDAFMEVRRGYLLGDLNASQQLTSRLEALVQINNLTNNYQSEVSPYTQQSGRTTGLGFRLHW